MSNDMNMMTDMALSRATQGNFTSHQHKALNSANEQDAQKKRQELQSASEGFEAIFIQKMWEQMRSSIPENTLHGSKEEKYWQSMYDQQLGKDMASGGGIGLADMMVQQLTAERLSSPTNAFGRNPLAIAPAPLMQEKSAPSQNSLKNNAPVNTVNAQNIASAQNINRGQQANQVANPQTNTQANQPNGQVTNQNTSTDNFYQQFEYDKAHNHTNGMQVTQAPVQNAQGQDISMAQADIRPAVVNNSQNTHAFLQEQPSQAEFYNTAITSGNRINQPQSMGNVQQVQATNQNSSLISQTLAELENTANPATPTVVRTTYVTNLPASERKGALLDARGNITKEHQAEIERKQEAARPSPMAQTASVQNGQNAPMGQNQMLGGTTNEYPIDEYPMELIPQQNISNQVHQNNQNIQAQANQSEQAKYTPLAPHDILAGIAPRYQRGDAGRVNGHNQPSISSNRYNTVQDVEAEINRLLGREKRQEHDSMYVAMTEEQSLSYARVQEASYQRNNPVDVSEIDYGLAYEARYNLNPHGQHAPQNQQVNQNENMANNHTQILQQNQQLMAALSNKADQYLIAQADPIENTAAGGPKFFQPEEVAPHKVSAFSPEIELSTPLAGEVYSPFGWRLDPFTKERVWHTGIDIQAPEGQPILAAADGVVSFAGFDKELGNVVIVDHANGMQSVYGHNKDLNVKQGEKIAVGTNIATVGMSGRATGPHLHFEIRHNGLSVNPEPYLKNIV